MESESVSLPPSLCMHFYVLSSLFLVFAVSIALSLSLSLSVERSHLCYNAHIIFGPLALFIGRNIYKLTSFRLFYLFILEEIFIIVLIHY
jgi:hypothetical protein